jgi:isoleucyl-tRNA synthetase
MGISGESVALRARYEAVRGVRRKVNAALEEARRQGRIGSSVEAQVTLQGCAEALAPVAGFSSGELEALFIVSGVGVVMNAGDLQVQVERA